METVNETDLRKGIVFSSSFEGIDSEASDSSVIELMRLLVLEVMVL